LRILRFVFLFGAFALAGGVMGPYQPLGTGTVMVASLIICICAGTIVFSADKDENVAARHLLACMVPWALAALLIANGAFDHSDEIRHQTVVVDTHYGRSWDRVIVRSWRPGRTNETLYIRDTFFMPSKFGFFLRGEPVTVGIRSGALGMPWISTISRK
jgi:hypothetical protein